MGDLTILIEGARNGDLDSLGLLFTFLYDELRRIAHGKLRCSDGLTLDTTGLVHEAYLRLVGLGRLQVTDRPHFLAYAARTMRSIVVDFARRKLADRRGGGALHVTLDTAAADAAVAEEAQILRLQDALDELLKIDERLVRVVEMRYFAGLEEGEIAEALGVSTRTVERDWEKARIYLYAALK